MRCLYTSLILLPLLTTGCASLLVFEPPNCGSAVARKLDSKRAAECDRVQAIRLAEQREVAQKEAKEQADREVIAELAERPGTAKSFFDEFHRAPDIQEYDGNKVIYRFTSFDPPMIATFENGKLKTWRLDEALYREASENRRHREIANKLDQQREAQERAAHDQSINSAIQSYQLQQIQYNTGK